MKKRLCLALAVAAITGMGCSEGSDDFSFSIYAEPSRTHAPGIVKFELTRDDGANVRDCEGTWHFGDGIRLSGDYEAEHRYRDAGSYQVEVELACGDKRGHATTDVTVYGTVDLSVGALEARPLDVSSDGALTVSFQASNSAKEALRVPTYIDVYLTPTASETAYLEAGAKRIYRHMLASLGAAGTDSAVERLEFEIPMDASIRTGAYYVTVVINSDHTIGESSYDNNAVFSAQSLMVRNQATDGADFVAKRLAVTPAVTAVLTGATAQFDILNEGSTTAETFAYEIWLGAKDNSEDMNGAVKIHESTIVGGMSGVEQNIKNVLLSIAPAVTDPGLYYFWLRLDTTNVIVERDETNNIVRSSAPIQVTNEPVLDADITIKKVEFSPGSTSPGGTFSASLGLYNQGAQPTGSFVCTVYLSSDMSLDVDADAVVGSINVDDLPALSSRELTAVMETDTGIRPGKYWVYTFCDSSGVVSEANEDNNIQRGEVQIEVTSTSDIDLVIGRPELNGAAALADGELFAASVAVCNKGKTDSGPLYVSVMRKNGCDASEREFSRIYIAGIVAGSCETASVREKMTCDFWCPNYTFSFVADSTMIVSETDESNNRAALDTPIAMSGDACVCAGDSAEVNNSVSQASKLKTFDSDMTLCPGDEDFFALDIAEHENFHIKVSHDSVFSPLKVELLRGPDVTAVYEGADNLYLSGLDLSDIGEAPVYIHVTGRNDDSANRYHLSSEVYSTSLGIDLAASDLTIDGGALNASDTKLVTLRVGNMGKTSSPDVSIGFYVSETSEIDESAWRIARTSSGEIAPGDVVTRTVSLKLPADAAGGTYHLIAKVDDDGHVQDPRPWNNIARTSAWSFERSCWDVLDPNESMDTARKITFTNGRYHHDDLAVCQSNRDFYAFDVKHGSMLDISATAAKSGDFDLVLYDAHGNEIDAARTGSATEKIHRDLIVGDQTLYLEVFLLENIYNAKETAYSLDIAVSDAPAWNACGAAYEPNDFPTTAYDLRQAVREGLQAEICPATDIDYYASELAAGDRLQIGFDTDSGMLRAALYAEVEITDQQSGEKTKEMRFVSMLTNLQAQTLDYTAVADGMHYLKLFTNVPQAPVMKYAFKQLGDAGVDLSVSGLAVSPEDPVSSGLLRIDFDAKNIGTEKTDYDIQIDLDIAGRVHSLEKLASELDGGESEHFSEKVTLPDVSGAGTLIVRVSAESDVSLNNNSVSKSLQIGAACQNDGAEPNDNILQATAIVSGQAEKRVICPGDEDWFRIDDAAGLKAELAFKHADGDLDLAVYDGAGTEVGRSETAHDWESVVLPASGTAYVRVKGADASVSNAYELTVK
ncbi:MAG: hypothetical protein IKY83_09025 [Proteobacteria bacterium]|nr:hypothetical protein [Pseudomonadota bacterium]